MPTHEKIEYFLLDRLMVTKQIREIDEGKVRERAAAMKEVGLLHPIRVRIEDQAHVITDGEYRYRAAKLLGWKEIACIVEAKALSKGEVIQRQLIANCQREDMKPLERARAIAALMEAMSWNGAETAARLAMSAGAVSKLTTMLTLPADVLAKVEAGTISPSAAYSLAQADPAKLPELVKQAENGATRDAIAGAVRRPKPSENGNGHPKRVALALPGGKAVSVVGGKDLEGTITVLEETLARLRKLRTQGVELATAARMFRDLAKA